jgi:acetate---CoA ligase (ADP-forming)
MPGLDTRAVPIVDEALRAVLRPRSIAVIGASHHAGVGASTLRNLLHHEFAGLVYAVNRSGGVIQCLPAYHDVTSIGAPVDLAVVAVPAEGVVQVARDCAAAGVRALIVLSAGFGEVGLQGSARQADLAKVCRDAGMRLVGPNCLGVINTDPAVRLNATFILQRPRPGRIGMMSQSGALGMAIIDYAEAHQLGISTFVSAGNKADVSGNDLLEYWEHDPGTDAIVLYMESFGNPRKFSLIARRVAARKPIIVMKSGRSAVGARAAASHTGALVAAADAPADALFHQAGMIRTDTLEQMFDVAALAVAQPLPNGSRVGIVTNAGGPAILCADACSAEGLSVPELADATKQRLAALLPPHAALTNPVDMLANASPEQVVGTISLLGDDPSIDAIVAIYIPVAEHDAESIAAALADAAQALAGRKPLVAVFMMSGELPAALRAAVPSIPTYPFPESAAIALARITRYARWRARPRQAARSFPEVRHDVAAAVVAAATSRGGGWLAPNEIQELFQAYDLPVIAERRVATPDEAASAAQALGFPVVLKAVAPGVIHKTDIGGIALDLSDADTVRQEAQEMAQRLDRAGYGITGFLIQPLVHGGVEMIAGFVHDPVFGPVVACGSGGVVVELVRDVSLRIAPLDRDDATEMVRDLKTFPLLNGYRGAMRCDVGALEDLLLRLSAMAVDLPAIVELDCNPVIMTAQGATVVDARVRVSEPVEATDA